MIMMDFILFLMWSDLYRQELESLQTQVNVEREKYQQVSMVNIEPMT